MKDPTLRLVDPEEIKIHPFYQKINWTEIQLKNQQPPDEKKANYQIENFEIDKEERS